MVKRASLLFGVSVAIMLVACTAPRVVEDSPGACSNGIDDDGDARVDCADPDCLAAGLCEASAEACANGVDDDGNGLADCEDPTCIATGACEPRAAECTVDPQEGCTRGLICSADGKETKGSWCALPGTTELHRICEGPGSCRPGLHCFGYCRTICRTEADCPRETFCLRTAQTKFGTCTLACIPEFHGGGCPIGTCVTPHSYELRFDDLDVAGICADPVVWIGTVQEGEPCEDPPSIARLSGMCAAGLVCYPSPDGTPRCRNTCGISQDGSVVLACANPAHHCAEAFPLDRRQPLETQLLMGICAP